MSIFINQVELIMQKITTSIPHRYSVCVVLMITAVVLAPVNPAMAQDWRFEPAVAVGAEYDDNATLDIRTDEEVELEGYLIDLSARISYASPKSRFSFEPVWRSRTYPDEPDFDSDDTFLLSRFTYNGNANSFGFRLNFDSQSIRTAERSDSDLEVEDPDDIPDNDSGRTFRNGSRENWRFTPYWRYQISDSSSFGATVKYVDASYKDQIVQVLNDYSDLRLNLDYRHDVSAVTTLVYGATVRDYDSDNADSEIKGYGIAGGFDRAMSPTIQLSARIGVEKTNLSEVESDPEIVGSIALTRKVKTINLDDRNYVQLHASVLWYLVPTFTIETEYRYTVLDRLGAISEGSNSNRVNLWFTWQPNTTR
jgi:hypothetical protein